jgi:OOP family OmpA-OmpF porin
MSRTLATIIAVMLSTPTIATAGAYVGIGIGGTRTESSLADLGLVPECPSTTSGCYQDLEPPPVGVGSNPDFAGSDVTYNFVAGWMFNQNIGIEVGYIDFGQATDDLGLPESCQGPPFFGCSSRQWTTELKRDGFQAFLIGNLPLNESVDLYGKAGMISWDADYQGYERSELYASGPPLGAQNPRINGSDDGTDMALGFGANLRTDSPFSLRADFTYYDFDDSDSSFVLQLMGMYNFK